MESPESASPMLFDIARGERAKEAGMSRAGSSYRVSVWKQDALGVIYDLAVTGDPFTADDVIRVVGLPDTGTNRNNVVGAVFSAAAKRGWIRNTGTYRKTKRAISHGRVVVVWVGAENLALP